MPLLRPFEAQWRRRGGQHAVGAELGDHHNTGSYSASKSAAWAVTNGLRTELRGQTTLVVGVHPAFIDIDMTAGINAPKTSPEEVVRQVLERIEQGKEEILVDEVGRSVIKFFRSIWSEEP